MYKYCTKCMDYGHIPYIYTCLRVLINIRLSKQSSCTSKHIILSGRDNCVGNAWVSLNLQQWTVVLTEMSEMHYVTSKCMYFNFYIMRNGKQQQQEHILFYIIIDGAVTPRGFTRISCDSVGISGESVIMLHVFKFLVLRYASRCFSVFLNARYVSDKFINSRCTTVHMKLLSQKDNRCKQSLTAQLLSDSQ